jgi:hypothetical protein
MSYKIEIRPLAIVETIEAYNWYELQRKGAGVAFLNELDDFYQSLLRNPKTYSYYLKPVREGKINRFAYAVVYELFETTIVAYSIFTTKQNPNKKRTL